ncbi:cation diffusion facilitator family transporter [Phenylobacterium sp.]|uniref:cation diffusion facilitator family transporter n=1 Tax=Phenylobacterium sp. TaxID=1871053 RepID=UPI0028109CF6|nr:cation diffusion facilitator family transporter [Phenylobacterium sp.]
MSGIHGAARAETAALTRRITALSVGVAAVLVAIKAFAWTASSSAALLASLADSALDLLASLVTFFAVRYAVVPPDAEHRFGHGKAEAFASLLQAGLVFASAALVAREAAARLADPRPLENGAWAVAVMLISIMLTGLLIAAQTRALRQTASVAVSGDRAHFATDLGSNLAALIGIAGAAWLGFPILDAVAAILVAALLLWGAIGVFREAGAQLMDRELSDEDRDMILAAAAGRDPRVLGVHGLRTRASGPFVHIQLHLDLDPQLTLEAAHEVLIGAERRILAIFPAADILIHPNPRGRAAPHGGPFAEADPA